MIVTVGTILILYLAYRVIRALMRPDQADTRRWEPYDWMRDL